MVMMNIFLTTNSTTRRVLTEPDIVILSDKHVLIGKKAILKIMLASHAACCGILLCYRGYGLK